MKRVNLGFGGFAQFNEIVSLVRGEEVVGVNRPELRVHSIHAPDALNEARGIPRNVVVDHHVRPMKVHAFRQNLGGHEDAVVVLPPVCVRIEVGSHVLADGLEGRASEEQNVRFDLVVDLFSEIFGCFF